MAGLAVDILLARMSVLFGFGMLILNFVSVLLSWHLFYSKRVWRKQCLGPDAKKLRGVTILKPLKGVDRFLEDNLRSFFLLDYAKYEIVFSIVDKSDPARIIVERLMSRFPHIDARMTIGGDGVSINPKINNMVPGYETAKYGLIWICDSNAIVGKGALRGMANLLEDQTLGLVHQVPRGMKARNFPANLEAIYYGTTHARMYLIANYLGISCTVGKSMLFRKSDLEKLGGLRAFGKYLAEDYFIGTHMRTLGLRHVMFEEPVTQPLGECTFVDYAMRRIRWTRLRKNMVPLATVFEPLSESTGCALLTSYGVCKLWNLSPWSFIPLYLCLWFMCDLTLMQSISRGPVKNLKNFVVAWFIREMSYLPLYFYALWGNTVGWRGNRFILRPGGLVIPEGSKEKGGKLVSRLSVLEWLEQVLSYPKYVTLTTSIVLSLKIVVEILCRSSRGANSAYDDRRFYTSQELQRYRARPLFGSIWQFLQLGLSMHLQNERNFYDTNYHKLGKSASEAFPAVASMLE
jgi:ceramide glucosyltransferase